MLTPRAGDYLPDWPAVAMGVLSLFLFGAARLLEQFDTDRPDLGD